MRIREFVDIVLNNIKQYKGEITDTLNPSVFSESQEALKELNELLIKHGTSETIIASEEALLPFIDFLRKRWENIAGSESSYLDQPKSKINIQCTILITQLIIACNQFKYKSNDKNFWLMPTIHMNVVAKKILNAIESISKTLPQYQDPYVYLESFRALEELKELASSHLYSNEEVSPDTLMPFVKFLENRWKKIQRTKGDYRLTSSDANVICDYLENYLCRAANINNPTHKIIEHKKLLMPDTNYSQQPDNVSDKLRDDVFATLKNEENLDEIQQHLTNALRKSNRDMSFFAFPLLIELTKFEKDDLQKLELTVYIESQHTIKKLKPLLEKFSNSNEAITRHTLAPFIEFLKHRWDIIDGSKASYPAKTNANQICELLADQLALAGYQINFLNRNQSRLLKPLPHHDLNEEIAYDRLRCGVLNDIQSRNDLIKELASIDKSKWKEFVNIIDLERFIKLVANCDATFDDLLQVQDMYTADEERSKTILFCLFEVYIKDRNRTNAPHKSYVGTALTHFTKIPTAKEKTTAAEEIQKRLISGIGLANILVELNDPKSELHKYFDVLNDHTLKKFLAQIQRAVLQLPVKQVEHKLELQFKTDSV